MRHVWALVFAMACSTNARTTPTERAKDGPTLATPSDASPSATSNAAVAGSTDAMSGPTQEEIDQAFHGLYSEHGAQDVRSVEWWRKNAAYVRPQLRAMLENGDDDQGAKWAMRILGDIGDPADVALLATVLTTWKADTARWTAAAALGAHPAREAGEALIAATNNANVDTASYAVDGLGLRKDDISARARLEELLDHPKSTIRALR